MSPPVCEVVKHHQSGPLCDLNLAADESVTWLTRFTSVESEEKCLTEVSEAFSRLGHMTLRYRVKCLKVVHCPGAGVGTGMKPSCSN